MDGTGPQQPLSDSQLERELESALGVEPSPEFLARVRTRVASEPRIELWRLAIRRWAFEPLAGLAVIGIVLTVVVPNVLRDDARSSPQVAKLSGVALGNAQQGKAGPVPERRVAAPAHARAGARVIPINEVPLRLSKPLFAPEDRDALVLLATAMEEGRVAPLPAVADERSLEVRELKIEPLVLDPLPQLAELGAL